MKNSLILKEIPVDGYEKVIEVLDTETSLRGIIAIHNTTLGPALGGIRAYPYANFDQALTDVLRLAKGMTYKSAITEVGTGGGKSVIIIDNKSPKPESTLLAFADAIKALEGKYICAEDVGISGDDLAVIRKNTPYIVGIRHPKSSGDPSHFTAWGGYKGIQASLFHLFGNKSVAGRKIAIQGLGSVGLKLARLLFWEGAELTVTDVDEEKMAFAKKEYGASLVSASEIFDVECDIFVPCALGGILNSQTIPRLKCKGVAGLANNQLLVEEDGDRLYERGILYAPDYVINAGGLINVCCEIEKNGYNPSVARSRVDRIYDYLVKIFAESHTSPHRVASAIAENNIAKGIGKRLSSPIFHH